MHPPTTTVATGSRHAAWPGPPSPPPVLPDAQPPPRTDFRADRQFGAWPETRPEPMPRSPHPPALCGVPLAAQLLITVLDAIDYGVLLVDHERVLHHANRLGRSRLRRGDALRLVEGRVASTAAGASALLADALRGAAERGLRSTLQLSPQLAVAVIPIADPAPGARSMVALLLSRHALCTPLALDAFARQHGLTTAESAVLHALAREETPGSIAAANDVALCTVRTQVIGIRSKTGARSTRELLSRLARVPPLVSVVCD